MLTVIVRYIFEEDGKYYPQVFFRWMFVWIINVRIFQKELILIKQMHQKSLIFVIIDTF